MSTKKRLGSAHEAPLSSPAPLKLAGGLGGKFGPEEVERARDFLARIISAATEGRPVRAFNAGIMAARAILEHARWSQEREDLAALQQLSRLLGGDREAKAWLEDNLREVNARLGEGEAIQ